MKICKFFLLFITFLFWTPAIANANASSFMTGLDLTTTQSLSNINLQNNRKTNTTVYGLYVRQYAYILPGQNCNDAIIIYPSSDNITSGAYVTPISINAGKKAAIGSNYLYNMIYEAIYYENTIIPSSPPGCSLPGCTWGSDTIQYNWCIYLGALAPISNSEGYSANVPPSASLASVPTLYNYNLISNYNYIGPIACNDQTLTCVTANQQTQAFS